MLFILFFILWRRTAAIVRKLAYNVRLHTPSGSVRENTQTATRYHSTPAFKDTGTTNHRHTPDTNHMALNIINITSTQLHMVTHESTPHNNMVTNKPTQHHRNMVTHKPTQLNHMVTNNPTNPKSTKLSLLSLLFYCWCLIFVIILYLFYWLQTVWSCYSFLFSIFYEEIHNE